MIMSIVRLAIGMVPVTLLAIAFFGFNIYGLGLALAAFFMNLILTSWSVGIVVSGVVMRNGMGAESLAWTMMFLIMPVICVYYPVSVLPHWLQWVAWALPPTYVFEGMRALILEQHVPRRPDDRGVRAQRRLLRSRGRDLPAALLRQRPPHRLAAAERGIAEFQLRRAIANRVEPDCYLAATPEIPFVKGNRETHLAVC